MCCGERKTDHTHPPCAGDPHISIRPIQRGREDTGKNLRINERIRKSPVRLIGAENEQIGIIDTPEAMRMAREAGLDLVEVAPQADPPVCRIMDYGKWKYQQKKKEQKARSHSKTNEMKEVRLRPGTDEHDLSIKTNQARHFIEEGHRVQFTILFKGRQMAHREIGFGLLRELSKKFEDIAHVEVTPRIQGRRMTMIIVPGVRVQSTVPPARPATPIPAPAPAPVVTPAGETQA